MMQKKYIKISIIIVLLLALINIVLCAVSFDKFDSINYFKSFWGFSKIASGEETYIQIREYPDRIILASPNNSKEIFEEYILKQGYDILEEEQLGSMHIVSKDGKEELVYFSVNKYYSKWTWE